MSYLGTPLGYIFASIFLSMSASLTFYFGRFFDRGIADLQSFFEYHPWLYLLLMPAIAMRLWAEERKTGTFELLITLPITVAEAVVGKFLAAWIFSGGVLALSFPLWFTVNYLGNPDNGVILCTYLSSWLMAGGFLALSSCASAVTNNQVIAFVIAVTICFLFMMTGVEIIQVSLKGWAPVWVMETIADLSMMTNFTAVSQGIIDIRNIFYFVSLISLSLAVNTKIIELKKV
jgi:ABC-2 type transport system permease protein